MSTPWSAPRRAAQPGRRSPRPTGMHPDLVRQARHPGRHRRRPRPGRRALVRPEPGRRGGPGAAAARRVRAQLRGPRPRHRPARPDRGAGSGPAPHPTARKVTMDPNRLTQKSQEALHDAQTKALRFGHTEVDGEHLLLALLDQAEGIVPRLLSQAGADPDQLQAALEAELSGARGSAAPGAPRARSASRSGCPGCSTPPSRRRPAQGRVRLRRAPAPRAARARAGPPRLAGCCASRALTRDVFPRGADQDPRQPAGHLRHARGRPTRRWPSTAPTWWQTPQPAGSTRSSAGTPRSGGSSRSCPGRPRTTRC